MSATRLERTLARAANRLVPASKPNRLQILLDAAKQARREIQRQRDALLEVHVPMSLQPKPENVPEPEVRAELKRIDRLLRQLARAVALYEGKPK